MPVTPTTPEPAPATETTADKTTPVNAARAQALKVAVSRAEAILLALLVLAGMGLWLLADLSATAFMKGFEPREEEAQLEHSVPHLQASLAMAQEELNATKAQLIKKRLELYEHQTALAALETFPPETAPKSNPPNAQTGADAKTATAAQKEGAEGEGAKKPPAAESRADTLRKREAAALLVNRLISHLDALQDEAKYISAEQEKARRAAAGDFSGRRWWFRFAKGALTLALSVILLLVLLGLVAWGRSEKTLKGRVPGLSADGTLMWWTVVGLLLVLFGYQTFEMAGAAVAGVAVLLIFFARVPWAATEKNPGVEPGAARAEAK